MNRCFLSCLVLLSLQFATAQGTRPIIIVNAKIPDAPGASTVLIAGDKIVQVGGQRPRGATVLDAKGATLVPGRIDAWGMVDGNSALGSALSNFDPYDTDFMREALSHGVTAVCLTPDHARAGINGLAAVVRLVPTVKSANDRVLLDASALCAGLGVGEGALVRAERFEALRKTLDDARRYRDAWLDYNDELETYVKELPDPASIDSGTKAKKKAAKPKQPAKPAAKGAKGKDGKDKGPKAPKQPPHDRAKDAIVRVLNKEIPLRIHVERAADVVNALELAEAFKIRLVLEGGREAYLVARELAGAKVPVILGPAIPNTTQGAQPSEYAAGETAPRSRAGWHDLHPLRDKDGAAALLDAAGVTLALGTGYVARSRFAGLNAGLYAADGLDPARAEAGVTRTAAEVLGVGKTIGRVAQGFYADLTLLDDAGAVIATLAGGQLAYRKDAK